MKLDTDREPDTCVSRVLSDKYWNYFTINLALLVTNLIGSFWLDSIFQPGWRCSISKTVIIYDLFLDLDIQQKRQEGHLRVWSVNNFGITSRNVNL